MQNNCQNFQFIRLGLGLKHPLPQPVFLCIVRSVIHGRVVLVPCKSDLSSVSYCTVANTSITFYKVPEQHGHVYLAGFFNLYGRWDSWRWCQFLVAGVEEGLPGGVQGVRQHRGDRHLAYQTLNLSLGNTSTSTSVVCPNLGHPTQIASFTKYKYFQVKNHFAAIVNGLSVFENVSDVLCLQRLQSA